MEYINIQTTKPPTAPLPREQARVIGREALEKCGDDLEVLVGRLLFALAEHGIVDHRNGWDE